MTDSTSDGPERNDATPSLTTAGMDLVAELKERLESDLPERDLVAIATAVTKAMTRGFKLGAAFVEDGVRQRAERAGLRTNFRVEIHDAELEEVDLWADQYGSEE